MPILDFGYFLTAHFLTIPEKYRDDPRFTFIRFEDRGHNEVFNDPDNTYKDEFNAEFDKWLGSLDYDYNAEENAHVR